MVIDIIHGIACIIYSALIVITVVSIILNIYLYIKVR